ncbi:MAG: ferritin family protein [Candidatus Aegiribacteria sp.]|nr:ferritin family protein [Candidatus Aegiribacteria sp.]
MANEFNAFEVLTMAERIESNAQNFYQRASEMTDNPDISELFSNLAVWEKEHESLFSDMKSGLSEEEKASTAIDPYDELMLYLTEMADEHVFVRKDLDPASVIDDTSTPEDIIDLALEFEKESILFFLALKRLMSKRSGSEKIQKIIDEEVSHMTYLASKKRILRNI